MINLRENKVFYLVLLAKVVIGSFLASHYVRDIFDPFVDYFISSNFSNPYDYFAAQEGDSAKFPYPAAMLYVLAIPRFFLSWIDLGSLQPFFNLFVLRLPLLLADLGIFFIMASWLNGRSRKRLLFFYWCSPVLIYISYIHGQLDVIPFFLLFLSMSFLFKEKYLVAAAILGIAIATKTHILVTVPFFILYLFSKRIDLKNIYLFIVLSALVFLVLNLPFLFSAEFYEMVFFNPEQQKVYQSFFYLNELPFYFIPASLLLLIVKGGLIRNYSRDIFIMFLGFSFSIILVFVSPIQGWYYWALPFLAYFFSKSEGRDMLLFLMVQALYLLYFAVSPKSDYLDVFYFFQQDPVALGSLYNWLNMQGIEADKVVGLVFTALQTSLCLNCYWIYSHGLENYRKHKINAAPFMIGIGGDSGVGKTKLSASLSDIFSHSLSSIIYGDDMHRWQRGDKNWEAYTHLDPRANHLHSELDVLSKLKNGRAVNRIHYDHNTGTFTGPHKIQPRNVIIFEGLHPFYIKAQRVLYDLKIFILPSKDLNYHWKIKRDILKRGYSKEKIMEQIQRRESASKEYIEVQSSHADILITPKPLNDIQNIGNPDLDPKVYYEVRMANSIYLEDLVKDLSVEKDLDIGFRYLGDDKQAVTISGTCNSDKIVEISKKYIPGLAEVGVNEPVFPGDTYGVLLLFIIYYMFEEAEKSAR